MKIKFLTRIVFFIVFIPVLFLSFSKDEKHSKAKLSLTVSINKDTCFYTKDTVLNLTIILKNNRILPYAVYKYLMASTYVYDREQFLVSIRHKNVSYRYISPILYKRPLKGKHLINKWRNFKTVFKINFKKLIENRVYDSIYSGLKTNPKIYREIDNQDFGNYTIQVKYYGPKTDTVYSNIVRVVYVGK